MPFDDVLAGRIRDFFFRNQAIAEKRMFGGLAFLLKGNLCVGVIGDSLIARVGPDQYGPALERPHVREFDFTGRPMRGWIVVDAEGIEEDEALNEWLRLAYAFAETLPSK